MDRGSQAICGTDTSTQSNPAIGSVGRFQRYVDRLKRLPELDPDPNEALRELIPVSVRRRAGAFFTTAGLAEALVRPFSSELNTAPIVLDPTCGAGDLLIASARHFKSFEDHERRLEEWSQRIHGRDLFEEFVLAARVRMYLEATKSATRVPNLKELFPHVRSGCSLSSTEMYAAASHIVLNPPFTLVAAPDGCKWRTGRVSAAALFLEQAAKHGAPGTRIAAVLPDVLRSGSGYEKWRTMIERHLVIEGVTVAGRFARWADVDVFLLHGIVKQPTERRYNGKWVPTGVADDTVGKHFTISVGPLIDYRSPKKGARRPYLTVDGAPSWGTISSNQPAKYRRFSGTVFKPPFVLVRRTSRFGDKHRAVATIVTGRCLVAVENHLMVLVPHNGSLASCEGLLQVLQDKQTTKWLDARIRCRHLTVSALRAVPWWRR
ncbi:MAG: N-6 DNA methylase [Candidatus Binatia bacterium]